MAEALEVLSSVRATAPQVGHGQSDSVPGDGEAFDKVLTELTAKSSGNATRDQRDATSKVTKRSRATSGSAPVSPASTPELPRVVSTNGEANIETPVRRADVTVDAQSPSAMDEQDALFSHVTSGASVDADALVRARGVRADGSSVVDDEDRAPSAPVDDLATPPMPAPPARAERATIETANGAATAKQMQVPTTETRIAPAASAEAGLEPTATATIVERARLGAVSAGVRRASLANASTTSPRSAAPRSGQRVGASGDAVAAVSRRSEGASPSSDRVNASPVIGPYASSLARPAVSPAPAVSSSTADPSLDVSDLANSISQATLGADGSYTVNVAMHPSDLGHVQAVVSLNGSDLHVAITPQTPTGHAALASAAESLKSELSRSGLSVHVSLRDPESRSGSGRGNDDPRRAVAPEVDAPSVASDAVTVAPSLSASQIHLIL